MNVVMKFGGTSVADAEAMGRVIGIVRRQLAASPDDNPPVVVVSAMSKVTDRLIETGRLTGIGDADAGKSQTLLILEIRHLLGSAMRQRMRSTASSDAAIKPPVGCRGRWRRRHSGSGGVPPRLPTVPTPPI